MNLDDVIDRKTCAAWLGVTVDWLARDAMKRNPKIPMMKLGRKLVRYHVRTVLARRGCEMKDAK